MATDPIKSKYYQGTFAGGQGPVLGQESCSEGEESTSHGGEGKKAIKTSGLGGSDVKPTGGDGGFSLRGKGYAGPENWQAENKGIVNPDDLQHS